MARRNFCLSLLGWLCFLAVYPAAEPLARTFGYALFWWYYPNANGAGVILSPLLPRRPQIRVDWHSFRARAGRRLAGGGRESILLSVPHVNSPALGIKHWPWKQHPWLYDCVSLRGVRDAFSQGLRRIRGLPLKGAARKPAAARVGSAGPVWVDGEASPLPPLRLNGERVVYVGRTGGGLAALRAAAAKATASLLAGQEVRVALDAEWGAGPRPLSLLQLAVELPGPGPMEVFLVDIFEATAETLELCRRLLNRELVVDDPGGEGVATLHRVLAFSPHHDLRRLRAAGVLPANCLCRHWIDLQQLDWGEPAGRQPSLQRVVRRCLGRDLDKRMQCSNWDRRPLAQAQLDYAALDASCLLAIWHASAGRSARSAERAALAGDRHGPTAPGKRGAAAAAEGCLQGPAC